jgi:septin family protein
LFIGNTGSGKTTTVKALLGYKMNKIKYQNKISIEIDEPVTDEKVKMMHSNPSSKSVTRYITAVQPKPELAEFKVYLCDTPGFGDTRGIEV